MELENIKLTDEEILKLFKFVESKYVRYKDLQYELVDHLASSIEEERVIDPGLSFDLVLCKVYRKFPITGFSNIVIEKTASLEKYWRIKLWRYFITFWSFKKLPILIGVFFVVKSMLAFKFIGALYFFSIIMLVSYGLGFLARNKTLWNANNREKYLFLQSFDSTLRLFLMFGQTLFIFSFALSSSVKLWFFAAIVSLFIAIMYSIFFDFPKLLIKEIKTKYSHLEIASEL